MYQYAYFAYKLRLIMHDKCIIMHNKYIIMHIRQQINNINMFYVFLGKYA